MKVTKLVHACLLIETDGHKILVDPGSYSWQSGLVNDDQLQGIDTVVITHAHPDHLSQDFAVAIHKNSPEATWYGPQQVIDELNAWGIDGLSNSDDSNVRFIESEHADLAPWFDVQPEHTSYLLLNQILVTGDCQTLTSGHGAKYLAAAINGGPWGAVVGFAKMLEAMEERPQVVLPLHDWHWNDTARQGIYGQLPSVLAKFDVQFVSLQNGVSEEV